MGKVHYVNVHNGVKGTMEEKEYEELARKVNRGRGILKKLSVEPSLKDTKKPKPKEE